MKRTFLAASLALLGVDGFAQGPNLVPHYADDIPPSRQHIGTTGRLPDGSPCIWRLKNSVESECVRTPAQPSPDTTRLEQRQRELQQQIQRDSALQQRLERDRQKQATRDKQAREWQQLQGIYEREMDRIEQEREREAAAERQRAARRELEELKQQLQLQNSAAQQARQAAPASSAAAEPEARQPDQPNPFVSDAKAAAGIKDPAVSHAGSECSFFTKPMIREGGSGLNVYADGSAVCYGKKMYKCTDRRWVDIGRCDMYDGWERHRAERLEN